MLINNLKNIHAQQIDLKGEKYEVVNTMSEYGWAFAGAFLSTVERLQATVSAAFSSGVPTVQEPNILKHDPLNKVDELLGNIPFSGASVRTAVIKDYTQFMTDMKTSWTSGATTSSSDNTLKAVQCASMLGASHYTTTTTGDLWSPEDTTTDNVIDIVFDQVDKIATWNGVWKYGPGDKCGTDTAAPGFSTFKLSVSFKDGAEVIQEIVRFGRANIDTGLRLAAWGVMAGVGGGVIAAFGFVPAALVGGALLAICELLAVMFLALGSIFAFLLPLVAFGRFFFAVLVWVGEVIESVIAIPVVALAHLNPEGEGFLSAQAKRAYEFIFSIFLRPIMTIFGLIAGLMLFIIAANFMNFAYSIAVGATGAMGYNHEVLTRLVFTILYVFTLFMAANMCFGLITDFPNGAVSWMAANKSKTPNIEGSIKDMEKYETIAAGLAIDKGVGAVNSGAKGISEKLAAPGGGGGAGGGAGGAGGVGGGGP